MNIEGMGNRQRLTRQILTGTAVDLAADSPMFTHV
jgi:hypothetical protein